MPRYRRHFAPEQTVFVTLATRRDGPRLASVRARNAVRQALRRTQFLHPFRHVAHAILDDHVHALLHVAHGDQLPAIVACWKRAATADLGRSVWQARYHDHVIRNRHDLRRHLDYVHYNPVRHGLATDPFAWPWSSIHAWQDRGLYPPDWGRTTPPTIDGMTE